MKRLPMFSLILVLVFHFFCAYPQVTVTDQGSSCYVESEYGNYAICDPALVALLHSPVVERLKEVHQYGVSYFVRSGSDFSRYDHSVGVMVLLRRFGASLEEQVAGLLHDASHTVFSHVADFLYDHGDGETSYQDDIHEWFLDTTNTKKILQRYGLGHVVSKEAKQSQCLLEQDLPDLCADRIEYILRGGLVEGILFQDDVEKILHDLSFDDGRWFFTSVKSARKLSDTSLYLTQHVISPPWAVFIYDALSQALKHALKQNYLTKHDIHFSTDKAIWQMLNLSNDDTLQKHLRDITNYHDAFLVTDEHEYDKHFKIKFRGVDPWVKTAHGFERLTSLDHSYACSFKQLKDLFNVGWYIKYQS